MNIRVRILLLGIISFASVRYLKHRTTWRHVTSSQPMRPSKFEQEASFWAEPTSALCIVPACGEIDNGRAICDVTCTTSNFGIG